MTLPPLEILDTVPSTMDAARESILTGRVVFSPSFLPTSGGVLTHAQTAGRGQRGRIWYAEPGANLSVTYYFRDALTDPLHAGELALLAGVAVAGLLSKEISRSTLPSFGLKWPNDVLLNDKKVGGILVEMVTAPDGKWVALIGVGINLSTAQFPPELGSSATSLLREGIAPPDSTELGCDLYKELHAQAAMRREQGFTAVLKQWRDYDQTPGRRYEAEVEGKAIVGLAEGVDENGALLLRTAEREILAVTSATSLREIG